MKRAKLTDNRAVNSPEVPFGFEFFLHAFYELNTQRLYENGLIPVNAIRQYARDLEVEPKDVSDLIFFVRHLDSVFLQHQAEKQKQKETIGKRKKS